MSGQDKVRILRLESETQFLSGQVEELRGDIRELLSRIEDLERETSASSTGAPQE